MKESKKLDADKAGLVAEYSQQLIQIYEKRNMQNEYVQELQYQVFECMPVSYTHLDVYKRQEEARHVKTEYMHLSWEQKLLTYC